MDTKPSCVLVLPGRADGAGELYHLKCFSTKDSWVLILYLLWPYWGT